MAYSNKAESSLLHELGHWYQYQKTKKENPNFNHGEIRLNNKNDSYKFVDNLVEKGYNMNKDISEHANINAIKNPEEVYAEKFVVDYFRRL